MNSKNKPRERKLRVFISMPFTGKKFEDLVNEREKLNNLVNSFGFELLEQFIGYQNKEDFETKDYDPSFILAKDKNYIKESDVVIADFTSLSIGTSCEVTIAKELFNKKVYAIVSQDNRKHSWLKFYCDYFFDSVQDALKQIKIDFNKKTLNYSVEKDQYNPIAIEYRLVESTPAQKYIYDPAVSEFIEKKGKNKSIVVLHGGSGYRCRLTKKYGAGKVTGIDMSHRQIQIAREEEISNPQGINYLILDPYNANFVKQLPSKEMLNKTEVVLGFFLLDHAASKEELNNVIKNTHALLKSGGDFFGMLDNPASLLPSNPKYGVVINADKQKITEGSPRRISIFQKDLEVLHFHNFVWKIQTIKNILEKEGFSQIEFKEAEVSKEGIKKYGEEFWSSYKRNPEQIIFYAKKK